MIAFIASLRNFLPFFGWLCIIVYLSFSPLHGWPQPGWLERIGLDKLIHIFMYAVLSTLLLFGATRNTNQFPSVPKAMGMVLLCASVGLVIEWLQPLLTMYRHHEWADMLANAAGSVAGYGIARRLARYRWRMFPHFRLHR